MLRLIIPALLLAGMIIVNGNCYSFDDPFCDINSQSNNSNFWTSPTAPPAQEERFPFWNDIIRRADEMERELYDNRNDNLRSLRYGSCLDTCNKVPVSQAIQCMENCNRLYGY